MTTVSESFDRQHAVEGPRVLLVDDHETFRDGLRVLLTEQDVNVVAEAGTGAAALALLRECAPDVVLMDLNMPGIGGIETTRQIAMRAPRARVVVLTSSSDDSDVAEAIFAGACGYLLKDSVPAVLVAGINAAAAGESLISPGVASKLLTRLRAREPSSPLADIIGAELTEREIEVLRLLSHGGDNRQIAATLFISPSTVKNHVSNILLKLHLKNRIQAAVYGIRAGIA